ncbi:MAG: alpha/beta hydrolase, partial [Desulfobacterales bacterium]|nr:alpha/beta hydrolase [Desulfobacterales bacterium]
VDYRLSPRATFPEHIIDCKKAFAWVKENIKDWGGNPDFIMVTGGSAGGHLSSLFALSANDPQFQPGFEDVDTRVQGCVPYYGVYDFSDTHGLQASPDLYRMVSRTVMKKSKRNELEAYHQASPMFRIHEDAPPFLIIHGDSDTLVSVAEARKFAEMLKETSKEAVAYAEIQGAQHAFDLFPSVRSEYVKLGIERFANTIYDKWLKDNNARQTL